jgi:hypothetical protein
LERIKAMHADYKYQDITLAKLSFYNCIQGQADLTVSKRSFLDFIRKHATKLDRHQKEAAMRIIRQVAEAYKGRNAKEAELEADVEKYLKS